MSYKLFKVNFKGQLEVVTQELLLSKEFVALHKSLGSDIAFAKVWRYIYEIADSSSKSNRVKDNEEERVERALYSSGLPTDWKPTKEVKDAIARYKADNYNPVKEERNELLATFNLYPKVISKVRENLQRVIDGDTIEVDKVLNNLDKLNSIAASYVKNVDSLSKALILLESKNTKDTLRGGGELRKSMIPRSQRNAR